jgi:hypothetical protein
MSEIRVENIIGETGTDAVNFTKGVNVTGVCTATSFTGAVAASQLTGALPAISGANLTGIVGGKIHQVVTQIYEPGGTDHATSSTSYVDTGMTLQITPSNTNSKIFIFGIANGHRCSNSGANSVINIKRAISGGSTGELSGQNLGIAHTYNIHATTSPIFFVDGTTGTAQRTYTIVHKCTSSSHSSYLFRANTSNMFFLAEILP